MDSQRQSSKARGQLNRSLTNQAAGPAGEDSQVFKIENDPFGRPFCGGASGPRIKDERSDRGWDRERRQVANTTFTSLAQDLQAQTANVEGVEVSRRFVVGVFHPATERCRKAALRVRVHSEEPDLDAVRRPVWLLEDRGGSGTRGRTQDPAGRPWQVPIEAPSWPPTRL